MRSGPLGAACAWPPCFSLSHTHTHTLTHTHTYTHSQIYGKTHYHLEGPDYATELVVFIHGVGDYGYRFEPMANAMNQAGYRTLRFDFFGRGFSESPTDCRFDVDMYVGHVQSLLQRLQLADMPVILVGHSMGGQVVRLGDAQLRAPSPRVSA
eukprot:COSAG03_NODE_860_length_5596_cov_16.024195_5_plen_153_part_00